MSGFMNFWQGLDWSVLTDMVFSVLPAIVCITVHETFHGLAALLLGDSTAKNSGRLSLNPLRHIDVFGLIMMVTFKFGWAKPVQVNMFRFKNPKIGMAITALAGPASNIILAVIVLFLYGLLFPLLYNGTNISTAFLEAVYTTAYLSTSLALFNLLPIPPLDGSKVLFSVLSDRAYYRLMRYEKYGMVFLFVVLASGVFSQPLYTVTEFVFDKLFFAAKLSFGLVT